MRNASYLEDRKTMNLLRSLLKVLSSTGISHHHRSFDHYFINYRKEFSFKIGTLEMF